MVELADMDGEDGARDKQAVEMSDRIVEGIEHQLRADRSRFHRIANPIIMGPLSLEPKSEYVSWHRHDHYYVFSVRVDFAKSNVVVGFKLWREEGGNWYVQEVQKECDATISPGETMGDDIANFGEEVTKIIAARKPK